MQLKIISSSFHGLDDSATDTKAALEPDPHMHSLSQLAEARGHGNRASFGSEPQTVSPYLLGQGYMYMHLLDSACPVKAASVFKERKKSKEKKEMKERISSLPDLLRYINCHSM